MGHMQEFLTRANNQCELCQSNLNLSMFNHDPKHRQCSSGAVWSEYSQIKIMDYKTTCDGNRSQLVDADSVVLINVTEKVQNEIKFKSNLGRLAAVILNKHKHFFY